MHISLLYLVLIRNHCQRITALPAAGDPKAPRSQQLPVRVRHGRYLLLLPQRCGECRGWWGDQTLLSTGAGELEPSDPKQASLPLRRSPTDRPMGTGDSYSLRCPAASQVWAVKSASLMTVDSVSDALLCVMLCTLAVQSYSGSHRDHPAPHPDHPDWLLTQQTVSVTESLYWSSSWRST